MNITLSGEFVTLRPLRPADAELTLAWRQSQRAINLNRGAATVVQQAAWIASRPESEYNFLITLKSGQAVGMVSLINVDTEHRRAEPARFLIGEEDAVRGIPAAVEAMKLVYELAFDQLGLLKVHGAVVSDNPLMLKWQKFLGMKEEGRLRQHLFINGHFQDSVMLGMLADEYRNNALPRMKMLIAAGRSRAAA
jgi:diamine N-acetyltransferase